MSALVRRGRVQTLRQRRALPAAVKRDVQAALERMQLRQLVVSAAIDEYTKTALHAGLAVARILQVGDAFRNSRDLSPWQHLRQRQLELLVLARLASIHNQAALDCTRRVLRAHTDAPRRREILRRFVLKLRRS